MSFQDHHRVSFAAAILGCGRQRLSPSKGNDKKWADPISGRIQHQAPQKLLCAKESAKMIKSDRVSWRTFVFASLVMCVTVLRAEDKTVAKIKSAHWIGHSVNNFNVATDYEIWVKGENFRQEISSKSSKYVYFQCGEKFYQYSPGHSKGVVRNQREENPLSEIERVKQNGKKIAAEKVEGVDCDKYEYESIMQFTKIKGTMWVSQATRFPVKTVVETTPAPGIIFDDPREANLIWTTNLKKVEINPDLPDSLFAPPDNVKFE